MASPKLEFLKIESDSTIPIPDPSFLTKAYKKSSDIERKEHKELTKYEREYDAFCRWNALPDDERNPKTIVAFEKKWKIPKGYTAYFRNRDDYRERQLRYFWDWMMEKWPNVVQSIYRGAVKGSSAQAKTFAELIAKHTDLDKPQTTIQNLTLIGVPQDRINALAVPQGYEKVDKILPGEEVKK
jgi:hypothetical protein